MHTVVPLYTLNDLWTTNRDVTHMYSLYGNKIDVAGAQAVAEGLQYCTNLQKLK
jgi:hypothetical protein